MSKIEFPSKSPLLGVDVSITTPDEVVGIMRQCIQQGAKARLNYINVHGMNLSHKNKHYREVLNASEVVFCDGVGVKLAARMLGVRLGDRMTPPDWIDDVFALCVKDNVSIYVMGDEPGIPERFMETALQNHPKLKFVGVRHGFFDMQGAESIKIIKEINESGADIIITGMGMPRQEIWAHETIGKLDHGIIFSTGALFRWYSGVEKRSPRWVTDNGFEWLARLIKQPRRHFRRYVVGNTVFMARVFKEMWSIRKSENVR